MRAGCAEVHRTDRCCDITGCPGGILVEGAAHLRAVDRDVVLRTGRIRPVDEAQIIRASRYARGSELDPLANGRGEDFHPRATGCGCIGTGLNRLATGRDR